ncbi:MAG TPA: hypothetical protein VJ161_06005 [Geobacteraceae bacterium]|nr:hypothetical protein [Geobacteraceae bacterium]
MNYTMGDGAVNSVVTRQSWAGESSGQGTYARPVPAIGTAIAEDIKRQVVTEGEDRG